MAKKSGDDFRDKVAGLLRAAGMNIQTEVRISGKCVDIVAETTSIGLRQKIAVECKLRKGRIRLQDISKEMHEYSMIVNDQKNDIDRAIFITDSELTPSSREYAKIDKKLSVLTFAELQTHLLNIIPYLRSLVALHGLNENRAPYIQLRTSTSTSLREAVEGWINEPGSKGLAIVAGYGRGKTTFAQAFSATLAERALDDMTQRLPILISLSDLEHSVRLSGVIADTIADRTLVERFSQSLFRELNILGRFILILDGFDEMKHGLDFQQFRSLFQQITQMIEGDAKVLLLGRPSAFMSDAEELAVMSDIKDYSESADESFSVFSKISIDLFSLDEGQDFVRSYAKYCVTKRKKAKDTDLDKRIGSWLDNIDKEILTRPVHARMLGELAAEHNQKPRPVNHYSLYEYFVDATILREAQKAGRDIRISAEARRLFIRLVAWWSWTNLKRVSFLADDIPADIFEKCLVDTKNNEAVRRELVVSSVLDRKSNHEPKLAFLHRSMQEYLVADHLLRERLSARLISLLGEKLTGEVIQFLLASGQTPRLQEALDEFQGGTYREFHIQFLRLLIQGIQTNQLKFSPKSVDSPNQAMLQLFNKIGSVNFEAWPEDIEQYAFSLLQKTKPRQTAAISIILLSYMFAGDHDRRKRIATAYIKKLGAVTDLEKVNRVLRQPGERLKNSDSIDVTTRALFSNVKIGRSENLNRDQVWVDFTQFYSDLLDLTDRTHRIRGLAPGTLKSRIAFSVEQFGKHFGHVADGETNQLSEILRHIEFKQ